MHKTRLILRSLSFHRRMNLGIVLGAALAGTVLVGALMVGDSVQYSLKQLTLSRLGGSDYVMVSGERFFMADLADRMDGQGPFRSAAVLILEGVALAPEGDRRINKVQVVGVSDDFWALAPEPQEAPRMERGVCLVNQAFADRMFPAAQADDFILRIRKPGGLPADMTLAVRDDDAWSRRLRVAGVLDASAFGRFTLRTTQIPPPTVFVPLAWLNDELELAHRANALLVADSDGSMTVAKYQELLDRQWQFADAGLRTITLPDGSVALMSDRVFIAQPVIEAACRLPLTVQPVISYFVNRISANERETPYSFAAAPGPPRVPATVADDEVVINDWLARDLGVTFGDTITLSYYGVDAGSRLEETNATFTVADIVPVDDVTVYDRMLTPDIPGLSDVGNCRDWDPGIPVDLERIRAADEAYWNVYGSTPKIYLTYAAAERLWRNRFGTVTALHFPEAAGDVDRITAALRSRLEAQDLGFVVQAAKAEGLAAGHNAVDFGRLFIGLSFFLITAAILLTVLLFSFNIQCRDGETGTLRALGFTPESVRRLFLAEGLILASGGAVLGGFLAVGYNALVLRALRTLWYDAVRTSSFQIYVRPQSVGVGVASVVLAAAASMALATRKQTQLTIRDLLQREPADQPDRWTGRRSLAAGSVGVALAAGMVMMTPAGQGREAMGVFFGAGSLLLLSLLALCDYGIGWFSCSKALNRRVMLARGIAMRRGRGLAGVALLALGVFLVIAVAANRRAPVRDAGNPAAGTGGYRLWAQMTLPPAYDLNTERGRSRYGLSLETMARTRFMQLRLREGDDASCLNLNRVTQPHLLGVDPAEFDRRGAFTFAEWVDGVDPANPWRILQQDMGADVIPVVADSADIVWSLGKTVGDTLTYHDENGREFQVKLMAGLANSILQGHLIMAESRLTERFPSQAGARVLLIETPAEDEFWLQGELTDKLSDLGLACVTTRQRLAEFNSVENTYLSIFMMLGGLGLLVGSAGMGIVAARNILERRSQLALLRAVGFRRRDVRRLLFTEHGVLAAAGTGVGALAAFVAVMPAISTPETVPWAGVSLTLLAILAGSLSWIWLAVHIALGGELITALREE